MKSLLFALIAACGGTVGANYAEVNVDTLAADLEAGKVAKLVDVRTPGEFASGHVPGAVNIPLDQIGTRVSELDAYKGGGLYLVCKSGGRSGAAAGLLAQRGFEPINVSGGTMAWVSSGRATE